MQRSKKNTSRTSEPRKGPRRFASRSELFDHVRMTARDELRLAYPNLTEETFERFTALYGPIDEAPKAHEHLRAIRRALCDAGTHLLAVQRNLQVGPDALEGPDRQLLDVLRDLDMWGGDGVTIPALNHAERAVAFRAHDEPRLRDRRSLVEAMLGSLGLRCTPRHFALMSLAIGFSTNGAWRGATVADIIDRETKTMRAELARLQKDGSPLIRKQIDEVVSAGTRGRPKKRS